MTTIKELRVIEIYEKNSEILIKKAANITVFQANLCKNKYDHLKEQDQTIKGIVFLIENQSIKDLTIIR